MIRRELRDPQPAGPARARGGALRAHREPLPLARDRRARRPRHGRQVDPRHPAAGGLAGDRDRGRPSTGPTRSRRSAPWSSSSSPGSGRSREPRCAGSGVSPGIAVGPRARHGARRGADLPARGAAPSGSRPRSAGCERALAASREQLRAVKERLSREVGRPARLHLRRAPADARGPAAARPRRRRSCARSGSTRSGRCARSRRACTPCSASSATPTCASAAPTSTT